MASCHARAVMLRRKEYRDETDYNIALTVANHMGSDGRPATVSLATIAEYVHCHYNTADKRVKAMTAGGQLITGRSGRYLSYSIPYDGDDGELEGDSAAVSEVTEMRLEMVELKEQVTQLAAAVSQLSQHLHTIVTRPSHVLHTSFTSADEANVNEVGKKGRREGEEEDKTPLSPQGEEVRGVDPELAAAWETIQGLQTYFSDVSGIAVPRPRTKKQESAFLENWGEPLWTIYSAAGKDLAKTRRAIEAVVPDMRRKGLTVSRPFSILGAAQDYIAVLDNPPPPAALNGNGHHKPTSTPAVTPPTDDRKARIARMINDGRKPS